MLIYEVHKAFEDFKIPYAIVGGYALAFHQIVRATVDVDLVLKLDLETFEKAEKSLKSIGLQSRIPVTAKDIIQFRKEYIENRNLIAWSFVDFKNPMRQVDILITMTLSSLKVEKISVAGFKIPVVSLTDLMKMKKKSGRPQDLLDVEMIEKRLKEIKNEKD